jgi:hypothetical protein
MFFTYMFIRQNDGTPYYVGKGSGYRAYTTSHRYVKAPRHGQRLDRARILVQFWPDEATAFEMEKFYIRLFGRKDNGTGILRNMTDGGDGSSGWIMTAEQRKRNAEHMKRIGVLGGRSPLGKNTPAQKKGRILTIAKARKALTTEILVSSGVRGGHIGRHSRWHVARNMKSDTCLLCTKAIS